MPNDHLSKQFDHELEALRSQVLQMGGLVESQVRGAIQSFSNGNLPLADQIVAQEVRVNSFEVQIDTDCSQIIVKRQPAATDLRLIMAVTKVVTDLERIGDEAHKVARMARQIHQNGVVDVAHFANIRHTGDAAVNMLRQALDAFARLDSDAAGRVIAEDRAIDIEFKSVIRQLITYMMEDPRNIGISAHLLFGAKNIERVGDHTTNIAETVHFLVRGFNIADDRPKDDQTSSTLISGS